MTSPSSYKVFGIGLNRTGTSTLNECAKLLGFNVFTGKQSDLLCDIRIKKDLTRIYSIVDQYNFFQDWPWPLIYKELDKSFPHSKFILTIRKDPQTWLNSLKKFNLRKNPLNLSEKLAYGFKFPHNNESKFLNVYNKHNENVKEYFKDKSNFIEICWEEGDGWDKLCNFLNLDMPNTNIPHIQKGTEQINKKININVNTLDILFKKYIYQPKQSTNIKLPLYFLKRLQEHIKF